MGVSLIGRRSWSVFDTTPAVQLPNPDPTNYLILRSYPVGKNLVVEFMYPDCTNYEGKKILVYVNTSLEALQKQRIIDPHFSDNKQYISPFARFEPTEAGWANAIKLAEML